MKSPPPLPGGGLHASYVLTSHAWCGPSYQAKLAGLLHRVAGSLGDLSGPYVTVADLAMLHADGTPKITTDQRVGVRVPPSAPGQRPLAIMKKPVLLPTCCQCRSSHAPNISSIASAASWRSSAEHERRYSSSRQSQRGRALHDRARRHTLGEPECHASMPRVA